MALKVELKPNERIIIGTVVIRADDQRTRLFIEGEAPILREKDILTHRTANSPAKRIYLAVQLMYLDQDVGKHHEIYFTLVREFLEAVPSSAAAIAELNNRILNGDLYKALKAAKKLITYESELLDHVLRGERLREDSPSGTNQPT
ncbi:MAG: flagellar biosynthesis repressor FlbT [Bosea sp. (in: a-proteobacteria)]